jgi:hypothetical protein
VKSLRKSFLKRTSVPKRSAIKRTNPARKRKEFARCYGPKERREFVKQSRICQMRPVASSWFRIGERARTRQLAAWEGRLTRRQPNVRPALGRPFTAAIGATPTSTMASIAGSTGCLFPDFNPETAAAETEKLWREHNDKA